DVPNNSKVDESLSKGMTYFEGKKDEICHHILGLGSVSLFEFTSPTPHTFCFRAHRLPCDDGKDYAFPNFERRKVRSFRQFFFNDDDYAFQISGKGEDIFNFQCSQCAVSINGSLSNGNQGAIRKR